MKLSRIWVAMLTRYLHESQTDSPIRLLIINGDPSRSVLVHDFPDTDQRDQERGQANLYEVTVEDENVVPEELEDNSVSIQLLGSDPWRPEHILVWGERGAGITRQIVPLAIRTDITNEMGLNDILTIDKVGWGARTMPINRLFMLITTAGSPDAATGAGTDSWLEIQIISGERRVVLFEIRDTTQDDLEPGQANFYSAPVIFPFTKSSLNHDSISLRIKGTDDWLPASFFLFGLDDASGRPENLVPLVSLPDWPYGEMEPDATTGMASVKLPLLPDLLSPMDEFGGALDTIGARQEQIIRLLEILISQSE